jgi:regulator of replication initiation timing
MLGIPIREGSVGGTLCEKLKTLKAQVRSLRSTLAENCAQAKAAQQQADDAENQIAVLKNQLSDPEAETKKRVREVILELRRLRIENTTLRQTLVSNAELLLQQEIKKRKERAANALDEKRDEKSDVADAGYGTIHALMCEAKKLEAAAYRMRGVVGTLEPSESELSLDARSRIEEMTRTSKHALEKCSQGKISEADEIFVKLRIDADAVLSEKPLHTSAITLADDLSRQGHTKDAEILYDDVIQLQRAEADERQSRTEQPPCPPTEPYPFSVPAAEPTRIEGDESSMNFDEDDALSSTIPNDDGSADSESEVFESLPGDDEDVINALINARPPCLEDEDTSSNPSTFSGDKDLDDVSSPSSVLDGESVA